MNGAFIDQMPTLSKYDPGESGEGGLDPLGLGAIADRIADRLVPGVRARMSQPRFVTLSAVGAHACQSLASQTSVDGKTTFELAFEWLVVESLVQYPIPDRLVGLPGSQKARRARAAGERLSAANYLAGPRVFGFTGVYRPFSVDSAVLDREGLPGESADPLLEAWEQDQGLDGFRLGASGSPGAKLRKDIERAVRDSLAEGHCTAPLTGGLMASIASHSAPGEAGARERREVRRLITSDQHPVRHELSLIMTTHLAQPVTWPTQRELAVDLVKRATGAETRAALRCALAYEACTTPIEYAFRRLLQHGASLQGGTFSIDQGAATPGIAELATQTRDLVRRAIDTAAELDEGLALDAELALGVFDQTFTAADFVRAMIARHKDVQGSKGKRMWIDPIKDDWFVRRPYRRDWGQLDDRIWTHPMRIETLLAFLVRTS